MVKTGHFYFGLTNRFIFLDFNLGDVIIILQFIEGLMGGEKFGKDFGDWRSGIHWIERGR